MEVIQSADRGYFDHGWLKSYHTFSFADYYDPDKINFGLLRVMNDDIIAGNMGFGMHPHRNMEIVTISLKGTLAHEDSTGQKGTITPDDVQIMSAGRGVMHSEKNPSPEPCNILQIWIQTGTQDVTPRYEQKKFERTSREGKLQLLVSPDGRDNSLWIYQNAFISRISNLQNVAYSYERYLPNNGVLVFVIEGSVMIRPDILNQRDSLLVSPGEYLEFIAQKEADILFIEVPIE